MNRPLCTRRSATCDLNASPLRLLLPKVHEGDEEGRKVCAGRRGRRRGRGSEEGNGGVMEEVRGRKAVCTGE